MTEAAANRLAGICAMLFAPLLIIGFGVIVGFSPLIDDPAAEVATYYRELNFGRARVPAAPALHGAVDIAQLLFMVWLFIVGAILLARPTRPLSEGRN